MSISYSLKIYEKTIKISHCKWDFLSCENNTNGNKNEII